MSEEKGSGRVAIVAFIREAERRGYTFDGIIQSLALAEDKAMAYKIKGLPVPADLTDDEAAGLLFVQTTPRTDA